MHGMGGYAAIRDANRQEQGKIRIGQEISATQVAAAREQMAIFQKKLEEFARKYKNEIRSDPDFRNEFNQMCMQIGVDPLQSRNGFWSKLLGVGEFYHELSIKVIDVCVSHKNKNGGMIPIEDVLDGVKKTYGKEKAPKISISDIKTALRNLKSIGEGYSIVEIGKNIFVKTVSFELDNDMAAVLNLAKDTGYIVDKGHLNITDERFKSAINSLLREGFVWVDQVQGQPPRYYVCALFKGFA